ncbi:BTAD domain-containing putative transcriptional regulator [Micromonospora sp. NBC_01739]|uniref:BTAD domain-containing putative transcriptional regulator n=1 Tax=Micromonospora sp. NBC_01739 TaxID=2975985 RepID=UPI002E0DDA04|nr:LysM peptidoglycan-binding domain-containing protein [Micromonospora sp. NBC_01739]
MRAPMSTATVAAVVLAAAPLGLLYLAGPDLIAGPPSDEQLRAWLHQPLTTGFLTALLQAAAWLLWALFATAVAHRVRQRVGAPVRWRFALRLPGPLQGLAAALLGATAVTSAALPAAAHTTSTADTSPPGLPPPADPSPTLDRNLQRPAPLPTVAASATPTDTRHSPPNSQRAAGVTDHTRASAPHRTAHTGGQPSSAARTAGQPAQADTCVVRPGDTLSAIAQQRLGDPDRWPEIWELNRGRRFDTGGGTFTNPHLIHPGWILRLPKDALPPATAIPQPPAPPPEADAPEPRPTTPDKSATTPVPSASAGTPPDPTASTPVDDASPATPTPSSEGQPSRSVGVPSPTSSPPAQTSRGITVGTGSWLDVGLAAAIAAAATLVWALRRRHYQRRPPSPARRGDADLSPLPAVVTRIRRSLRQHNDNDIGVDILDTTGPLDAAPEPVAAGDDVEDDRPASSGPRSHEGSAADAAAPVVPALDNSAAVWPAAGLGLTGPGAHAAGRGFLTAALAAGNAHDPHTRGSVVIPSPTTVSLLDAAALPASPRLTVTRSLADALDLLETLALHRTRLVYQHEVDTIADLRHRHPDTEPQPPVLLIADTAARHERVRIAALLAQGQRLDIHGILLGPWPEGDTVAVATDGTTSPTTDETTRHTGHPADLGRLTVLTAADTIDLITTLTEAHTGTRHTPPTPPTDLATTPEPTRHAGAAEGNDHAEPGPSQAAAVDTGPETGAVDGLTRAGALAAVDDRPEPTARPDGRVAVRTLGTARIVDMDTTVPLRAKALELLVYLVVHDGDATQDAILDDLLPDAPRSKAPHRLHTYVSALRKTLTRTGGATGSYLTHPGRRYTLNRELIDADLWRMRDALRATQRADNPDERLTALRTAVNAYQGALADGFDYEWIEAPREAIRRQALDAHLALAAATPDPAEAITVLTTAIHHDPYAETVYQHAMRAHAALGHLDQIHALRRTLTHRLHDIDTTPSQDTLALADQLITELQASSRDRSRPDASGQRP